MKKFSAVLMILVFAGLFLTSCEKELLPTPAGNTTNEDNLMTRGGTGDEDGEDDDGDPDSEEGITDGGRDEDFDKSSKKKPRPN